jgi:lysophospholipase L1-like esterase
VPLDAGSPPVAASTPDAGAPVAPEAPPPPPPDAGTPEVDAGVPELDAGIQAAAEPAPRPPLPEPPGGAFTEGASWAQLRARLSSGAPIRAVHLGDSEIAGDAVASRIRAVLAERLGDAGPGFVLAAQSYSYYQRAGFRVSSPKGFTFRSALDGKKGRVLGLGGMAFDAERAGASLSVRVQDVEGPCTVRFHYLEQPRGGTVAISADGKPVASLSTGGDAEAPKRAQWDFEQCPRSLSLTAARLPVKVHGWDVRRAGPGVSWSALGIVASSVTRLVGREGAPHLVKSVATLEPDLVVLGFGLNVVGRGWFESITAAEEKNLRALLEVLRAELPGTACVVMTPYPLVERFADVPTQSDLVHRLVERLRPVAVEAGCSFIDREALAGGPARALQWRTAKRRLLSTDNIHLTPAGADVVGEQVANLLMFHAGVR